MAQHIDGNTTKTKRDNKRTKPNRTCKQSKTWTTEKLIVGSMDIKSMYPSITIEQACKSVYQAILNTKLQFDDLDYFEIGKYIKVRAGKQEKQQMEQLLPKKLRGDREVEIGYLLTDTDQHKRPKWGPPNRQPTPQEKKCGLWHSCFW